MSDATQEYLRQRQAMIEAAREPPTDMEIAMQEIDRALDEYQVHGAQVPDAEPSIVLTGADMAAFDEFSLAAAALEAHAEQQQPLQQRYRTALEAVSRMAAKRNRGG